MRGRLLGMHWLAILVVLAIGCARSADAPEKPFAAVVSPESIHKCERLCEQENLGLEYVVFDHRDIGCTPTFDCVCGVYPEPRGKRIRAAGYLYPSFPEDEAVSPLTEFGGMYEECPAWELAVAGALEEARAAYERTCIDKKPAVKESEIVDVSPE